MNKHRLRFTFFPIMLLFAFNTLWAQDDYSFYLQNARQRLAEGDCDGAQRSYTVYKDLSKKIDKSIEIEIADCISRITAKNEAAENLNKAQEYIRKGECDNAQQYYSKYKQALNVSNYELERQIDDCLSQEKAKKEAAQAEKDAAQKNLDGIAYCNSGYYKQAADCFRQSANQGNMYAQYNLGQLYETGLGVEKNISEAKYWYQKAANQGNASAINRLTELNQKKYVVGEAIRLGDKPYYVAYVDYTGQHGWAIWPHTIAEYRHYSRDIWESTPTIDELQLIYDNRYLFDYFNRSMSYWKDKEYWSSTYVDGKTYTLDFKTGKRKARKNSDQHCHIFIRKF